MAIDRGGLRYEIEIVTKNIKALRSMRQELTKTISLQKTITREAVKGARAAAQVRVANARAILVENRARREKVRLRREMLELRRETEKGTRAEARRTRVVDRGTRANRKQARSFDTLARSANRTVSAGNRVAFTFRRLFGILAAFTAARLLVGGFRDIIAQGISFNAFVEQAVLGIRSLFTATGRVFGPDGQLLTGLEKFNATTIVARDQLRKLREDAQNTAATFRTLIETFQIALAPGLAAGLGPDEIRKLTVRISQAAAAIGLPQNQLAEEIRSLLAGTIQPRTTRIATSLGITNEDIRRAKELGTLASFLFERFDAFNDASTEALGNLNTLLSNMKDQLDALLGTAFEGFFQNLKDAFGDLRGSLGGDEARIFAEELGAALDVVLQAVKAFGSGVGFEGITQMLHAFNIGLRSALLLAAQIGSAITLGLADSLRVLAGVLGFFTDIAEKAGLGGALGTLLRWVVAVKSVAFFAKLAVKSMTSLVALSGLLALRTARATRAMAGFAVVSEAPAATTALLAGGFRNILKYGKLIVRTVAKIAAPLAIALLIADAIWGIFSSSNDELKETKDTAQDYTQILNDIPPVITAANQELKKQAKIIQKVTKETELLEAAFSSAIRGGALSNVAARLLNLVTAARAKMEQQQRASENSREAGLLRQQALGEDLIAQEQKLHRDKGITRSQIEQLTELSREQAVLAAKAVANQRKLESAEERERQARTQAARRALQDEAREASHAIERQQSVLRHMEERRALLARRFTATPAGFNDEAANELIQAAIKRANIEKELSRTIQETRDITESLLDGTEALTKATALRAGTIIAKAVPAAQKANKELLLEVELLEKLASIDPTDKLAGKAQQLRAQEARLLLTREQTAAIASQSIVTLRAEKQRLTDKRAQEQVEKLISAIIRRERLEAEQLSLHLAIINRSLDDVRRAMNALSRTEPISSAIAANPETIENLQTVERLLQPLRLGLEQVTEAAKQVDLRKRFREAADPAVKLQQVYVNLQKAQDRFITSTGNRILKLRNDLEKATTQEATLRAKLREGEDPRDARHILDVVGAALAAKTGAQADALFNAAFEGLTKQAATARQLYIDIRNIRLRAAQVEEQITDVQKAQIDGAIIIEEKANKQIETLAGILAVEALITAEKERQALEFDKIAAKGDPLRGTPTEKKVAQLQAEGDAIRLQINLERESSARRIAALQSQQVAVADNEEAARLLGEAIVTEADRSTLAIERMNIALGRTVEEQEQMGDKSFVDGLRVGLENVADSTDTMTAGMNIAQSAAADLGDALTDALLEPQSAGERLAKFFKGLVRTILQELARLAIAKGLAAIGFGGVEGGSIGLVKGGPVPQGLASGGRVRGQRKGLDPRDTVPIMAQPGEFMQSVSAVRHAGRSFMEDLNARRIPAPLLRALGSLARGTRLPRASGRGGQGYATGGSISKPAAPSTAVSGDRQVIEIRATEIVNDGLSADTLRTVSPSIKEPRSVAEVKEG